MIYSLSQFSRKIRKGFWGILLVLFPCLAWGLDVVPGDFQTILNARSNTLTVWGYTGNQSIYVFDFPGLTMQGLTFNRVTQLTEQVQAGEGYPRALNNDELAAYIESLRRTHANFAFGHDVLVSEMVQFYNLVDNSKIELFPEELKYEDAASHFIRHTDQLPRKTRGIYSASKKRDNKYYLDVSREGEIDQSRLSYLVWLTVGSQLKPEGIGEFNELCASIAYDHSVRLFEHEKHIFASPKFDDVLRSSIIDSIVSKQKWEAGG